MLPSVLIEAEQLRRERIKELMGLHLQNPEMIHKTLDKVVTSKPKVDVFGGREPSFVEFLKDNAAYFIENLYSLENSIDHLDAHLEVEIMEDAIRRAGETIARRIYQDVKYHLESKAEEQADKEFSGLKEKRRRFEETISEIRKTQSNAKRAKLAALYVFEEERMQYEDDVAFSEQVSDEDFKRHLPEVSRYCCYGFNHDEAVKKACDLMNSGRMKGKNFRKPKE